MLRMMTNYRVCTKCGEILNWTMQDSILGKVGKGLAIYFGGAWVIVEAASFLIERYQLDAFLIEILMIVLIFGALGYVVTLLFPGFNRKTIPIHIFITLLTLFAVGYQIINPAEFTPSDLRILKISSESNPLEGMPVLAIFTDPATENDRGVSQGFEREIRRNIQRLGEVNVVSRTTVLALTNSSPAIASISSKMDVAYILEIQPSISDTLVHARLILYDGNGLQLWREEHATSLGALPALGQEIAREVNAIALGQVKSDNHGAPDKRYSSRSLSAYYNAEMHAGVLNREGFDKAQLLFEESIREDSSFVSGYAGLAFLWVARKQVNLVSPQEADMHIRNLIAKAMEVDELDAQTWAVKGAIEFFTDYDFEAGIHSFEQSIQLDPGNILSRASYAHALMILGRWEEAWEQIEYAEALDPFSPWVLGFKSVMEITQHKFLSASKTMETLEKLVPDHPFLAMYQVMKANRLQRKDKAIVVLKTWISSTVGVPDVADFIQKSYDQNSSFEKTIEDLVRYLQDLDEGYVSPFLMLQLEGNALGKADRAAYWIQQMYAEHNSNMPYITILNSGFWRDIPEVKEDPDVLKIVKEIKGT